MPEGSWVLDPWSRVIPIPAVGGHSRERQIEKSKRLRLPSRVKFPKWETVVGE